MSLILHDDDDLDEGALVALTAEAEAAHATGLGSDQQRVVDLVLDGKSVLAVGGAGVGKSWLISHLARLYKADPGVCFTATTGIAAVHIGGITIHSFAGVKSFDVPIGWLLRGVLGDEKKRQRWRECRLLFIDEISMLSSADFDKLDEMARKVRGDARPFGGIQLVVSGDFMQLLPVPPTQSQGKRKHNEDEAVGPPLPAFMAASWDRCLPHKVLLRKNYRQQDNDAFQHLLNGMRFGTLTPVQHAMLTTTATHKLDIAHGVQPVVLYPHRLKAQQENQRQLDALEGKLYTYSAKDTIHDKTYAEVLKDCPAPETVSWKVGAQVMLLKNLDVAKRLVNGACGVVVATRGPYPEVRFESGEQKLVSPEAFEISVQGRVVATRTQIPLNLAWALTIHKSQGMTLDRAVVHAQGIFADHQLYVGVSRVCQLEHVRIVGYWPSAVRCNAKCAKYMKELEAAMEALEV